MEFNEQYIMDRCVKIPQVSLINGMALGQSSQTSVSRDTPRAVRTLYFHTGTQKTGSSALQAYLYANKFDLGVAGVSYEFINGEYLPLTGNGQHLFNQIRKFNISDSQLEELLELYFTGRETTICSSEDFTWFKPKEWQQIKHACQRLQVQAKFVTFVRNIDQFYYSAYGQLVKNHGLSVSFDEFYKQDQYLLVLDSLKCLLDVFGRESMSVIHYESAMNKIDSVFMAAIGLLPENYDSRALQQIVNRSLTKYEQEIISRVNESIGPQYGSELAQVLIGNNPHLKPSKNINPDIIKTLTARHTVDIGWLNRTFFAGAEFIKIGNSTTKKEAELSAEDKQVIDRDVANWCIAKLQSAQSDSIKEISARLHAIDWKNAGNPAIPENFDPIAYLLLNPDVSQAGVPPYEHFIVSGQHEGRRWEWTNQ